LMLGAVFVMLIVQSMNSEPGARVSFSHQVDHLVNLDLIQPQNSTKIALHDNLVTFQGKFREQLSDEGKARFRYVELLNAHHELQTELTALGQDLTNIAVQVRDAADWFLHLSGIAIPEGGYRVVSAIHDAEQRQNAIIIKQLSDRGVVSLQQLQTSFAALLPYPTPEQLSSFGEELLTLVRGFRSPVLGIGNEAMKQQLQALQKNLSGALQDQKTLQEGLSTLQGVVQSLNKEEGGVRLVQLRSVRNYKATLQQYNAVYLNFDR